MIVAVCGDYRMDYFHRLGKAAAPVARDEPHRSNGTDEALRLLIQLKKVGGEIRGLRWKWWWWGDWTTGERFREASLGKRAMFTYSLRVTREKISSVERDVAKEGLFWGSSKMTSDTEIAERLECQPLTLDEKRIPQIPRRPGISSSRVNDELVVEFTISFQIGI